MPDKLRFGIPKLLEKFWFIYLTKFKNNQILLYKLAASFYWQPSYYIPIETKKGFFYFARAGEQTWDLLVHFNLFSLTWPLSYNGSSSDSF